MINAKSSRLHSHCQVQPLTTLCFEVLRFDVLSKAQLGSELVFQQLMPQTGTLPGSMDDQPPAFMEPLAVGSLSIECTIQLLFFSSLPEIQPQNILWTHRNQDLPFGE